MVLHRPEGGRRGVNLLLVIGKHSPPVGILQLVEGDRDEMVGEEEISSGAVKCEGKG